MFLRSHSCPAHVCGCLREALNTAAPSGRQSLAPEPSVHKGTMAHVRKTYLVVCHGHATWCRGTTSWPFSARRPCRPVGISAGRELAADAQPAALRGGASTLIAQGPGPRKANPRGVIRGGKYSGVHFWTLFRARKSVNKKGGCTVVAEYFVDGFRGRERCPLLVLISVPRLMACVFGGGP